MKKITIGSEGRGSWGLYWVVKAIREKFKDCEIVLPPYVTQWSPDLITGNFDNVRVQENSTNCDFIIKSNFGHEEANWNKISKKYIYWSGESYGPERSEYELDHINIFSTKSTGDKSIYMPFFMYSPHLYKEKILSKSDNKKFIAYCSNNSVPVRENIFNLFVEKNKKNQCFSYGNCYGKYPETNKKLGGCWFHQNLIETYSGHDFGLAMENKIFDGYITEKILNVYHAGCIPIFYGDSVYAKFIFNEKAFIDVLDYNTLEECVQFVSSLSEEEKRQIKNQQLFNKVDGIDVRKIIEKDCVLKINSFLFD